MKTSIIIESIQPIVVIGPNLERPNCTASIHVACSPAYTSPVYCQEAYDIKMDRTGEVAFSFSPCIQRIK